MGLQLPSQNIPPTPTFTYTSEAVATSHFCLFTNDIIDFMLLIILFGIPSASHPSDPSTLSTIQYSSQIFTSCVKSSQQGTPLIFQEYFALGLTNGIARWFFFMQPLFQPESKLLKRERNHVLIVSVSSNPSKY